MREIWMGLLLLLLGIGPVAIAGQDGANARLETAGATAGEESNLRHVVVSSGPCPGRTEAEAREEAAAKADRNMVEALEELASERARTRLSDRDAWREWGWLLRQPGVKQDVKRSCVAKEYGPVAAQEISLWLPHDVLTDWTARLEQQAMLRWQARLLGGMGTILLAVAALLAMVVLDRRTSGYHRGLVIGSVLLGWGLLVAAIWVWLLWAF